MRALLGVTVLLTSLLIGIPAPSSVSEAAAAAGEGPTGRYFAVRTMERGNPPKPRDMRRCREHFGTVQGAVVAVELDAHLFSFTTRKRTGVVRDETARRLSPGYLCVVHPDPTGNGGDLVGGDAFAVLPMPATDRIEMDGYCALVPSVAQSGAGFFNCRFEVLRNRRLGVVGGTVTSNSILNPAGVPGNPTGSIWTSYVERRGWPALEDIEPAKRWPGLTAGDPSGQRTTFVAARGKRLRKARPSCPRSGRTLALRRVQPRLNTGELRAGDVGRRIGKLNVCLPRVEGGDELTTARVEVTGPSGDKVTLAAQGRCHNFGRAATNGQWQRTCELQVLPSPADGVQGGLITTVGLAGKPATRVGPGRAPQVTVSLLPSRSTE